MASEIERKFLVSNQDWRSGNAAGYRQGYLSLDKERSVRIRMADDTAQLTVKGVTKGATRKEFEYEIPLRDAREILATLCLRPLIEKRRYRIRYGGLEWEIDEFYGDNAGLVVAEVELEHEDQHFERPAWLGQEVTGDPRYYNVNLVQHPYSTWQD